MMVLCVCMPDSSRVEGIHIIGIEGKIMKQGNIYLAKVVKQERLSVPGDTQYNNGHLFLVYTLVYTHNHIRD